MTTQTDQHTQLAETLRQAQAEVARSTRVIAFLREENQRLRALNTAALRTDNARAMRRTIEVLHNMQRKIPGLEHSSATYFPYYSAALKLEEALSELEDNQ